MDRKSISEILYLGIVSGVITIIIGIISRLKFLLYSGIMILILTPPTALIFTALYLFQSKDSKIYGITAIIDALLILLFLTLNLFK